MRVNLRVNNPLPDKDGKPKKGVKKEKPVYTPAVIASSKIDFAYIDEDGDVTVKYAGTEEYYAIQNKEGLLDELNKIVENKFTAVKGFVDKPQTR